MSVKNNTKRKNITKKQTETNILNIIVAVVLIIAISTAVYFGIKIYNPKKQKFIKGSNYAFKILQSEVYDYYKKNKTVYTSKDEVVDKFCKIVGEKYGKDIADCSYSNGIMKKNFTFKNTKIEIWGMEKPPYDFEGTLVKDFIIDVDGGDKGDNLMGSDRVPIRIYSTNRMGGLISPVNCKHSDDADFDIPYASICANSEEINYMAEKIPFGFDVYQIGGKQGKTKAILRDVSFIRADCAAFGGEMAAGYYCDEKGIYWLQDCYDEYVCAVWLSKTKL